jgi:hypothetical protein
VIQTLYFARWIFIALLLGLALCLVTLALRSDRS